jgi:hypothetical protein
VEWDEYKDAVLAESERFENGAGVVVAAAA